MKSPGNTIVKIAFIILAVLVLILACVVLTLAWLEMYKVWETASWCTDANLGKVGKYTSWIESLSFAIIIAMIIVIITAALRFKESQDKMSFYIPVAVAMFMIITMGITIGVLGGMSISPLNAAKITKSRTVIILVCAIFIGLFSLIMGILGVMYIRSPETPETPESPESSEETSLRTEESG